MKAIRNTILAAVLAFVSAGAAMAQEQADKAWQFRVFVDDKEVGTHVYRLEERGGRRELVTEADFEYKALFLTLYDYEHRNEETWEGDCLAEIRSRTDDNGELYRIEGERREGSFVVDDNEGTDELPACVMSFAYWNPAFLQEQRLLNSQNGDYLDVEVSEPTPDTRMVRGESVPAMKYRLRAGELDLRLWYTAGEGEWLALESITESGRVLRYELM